MRLVISCVRLLHSARTYQQFCHAGVWLIGSTLCCPLCSGTGRAGREPGDRSSAVLSQTECTMIPQESLSAHVSLGHVGPLCH